MIRHHQRIPAAGPAREALREKGQFWTPGWVAEAMVAYVAGGNSDHIFDPAVGEGAFFQAAKTLAYQTGRPLRLLGTEIDPDVLERARLNGLSGDDLAHVDITDFVLDPPIGPFMAVVANPPYIRHHRLSSSTKEELKKFCKDAIGTPLDGRMGLHVYFLIRALKLLDADGRLSFIVPSDICEGIFATTLWDWITRNFSLDAVITFTPQGSPFPKVDTNPIILMIRNSRPAENFLWARCDRGQGEQLKSWVTSDFSQAFNGTIAIHRRSLLEGLTTGLSRVPLEDQPTGPTLADFASIVRGVATGANEFFFLTSGKASSLGIPDEFLVPAIGRTRDVTGSEIVPETIDNLDANGRPTRLFSLDRSPLNSFPQAVQRYLEHGESLGIHKKPLISKRSPWYRMEERATPPILFAYLGRRNARFIRNLAEVVPLTGFLCVYPHKKDLGFIDKLWKVLQHPETIANLSLVGKSYGSGAIKVEPRALERLPLPVSEVLSVGLEPSLSFEQLRLTT